MCIGSGLRLKAFEKRSSEAFNLSPLPMHIISVTDEKYIAVNDSFLKVTGLPREEVIGKTGAELNLWATEEDRQKVFNAFKKDGRLDNVEVRYRRNDGEVRTILASSEAMTLG